MGRTAAHETLMAMYQAMLDSIGPSQWWPADSPFEVLVGCVLAQNTRWANASRAVEALKDQGLMNGPALLDLLRTSPERAQKLLRPAGHFRVKAARLENLLHWVDQACGFDLDSLAREDMDRLRADLLRVKGVGPETADSVLLYALGLPSFVVDAYTFRIMNRHGLIHEEADYHELRDYFMDRLPIDAGLYNEFHALLVRVGAGWCAKKGPDCQAPCPLAVFLNEGFPV